MKPEISKILDKLQLWDLIVVTWWDSSSDRKDMKHIDSATHDTLVVTPGFYLGIGGRKRQHLILGRDAMMTDGVVKYDNIILDNIEAIEVKAHCSNPFGKEPRRFMKYTEKRGNIRIWK